MELIKFFLRCPRKPSVLIDSGALLECTNEEAIHCVLSCEEGARFRGGLFVNDKGRLTFCDRSNVKVDFSKSPLSATNCFVLFDDAHCRGTDILIKTRERLLHWESK